MGQGIRESPRWDKQFWARLMESQIWFTPDNSVAVCGRAQENNNNGLCQHFCLEKPAPHPSSYPDAGQFSSFLYVSDAFQPAVSWTQTESKSVHGPFKRKYLGLQKFLSSTALIPIGFYSQKLWKLIFQHWNTELGGLVWGWDPFLLRYPSQFLSPHMGVWPAHYTSPPLLPVLYGFLFNFTVVGLPFSLISDGSEWWLFYRLVVIFMYLCREASHVPLYCHLFH